MVKQTLKSFKAEYAKLNPNDPISHNELKELHKGMTGGVKVRKTRVPKGKTVKIIHRPTFKLNPISDPQEYSYILGKNRVAKIVDTEKPPKMINVKVPVVKMVRVERKKPTKKASGEKAPPKKRGRPKKTVVFE
jgi:hypothetical protein